MHVADELNDELLMQPFGPVSRTDSLEEHERTAAVYARAENAIAVLSDLKSGKSRIWYGGAAERLGIAPRGGSRVIGSIWEEEILRRIHPDDLGAKQLLELRFFRFLGHVPDRFRADYCLMNPLRMRDSTNEYLPVLHRICYVAGAPGGCVRLTLCLYNLCAPGMQKSYILNTADGRTFEVDSQDCSGVLSPRELEVLKMIDMGMISKEMARRLSISIHTVNRHRQNILMKLRSDNSFEACRIARQLGLL